MRLLILAAAAILFVPSAMAQGTIRFANDDDRLVQWSIPPDTSGAVPASAGFVQLLWAPEGTPIVGWETGWSATEWLRQNPAWSFAGLPVPIGPQAGRFDGGIVTVPTTPGATIDLLLAGWAAPAADFETAWDRSLPLGGINAGQSVKTGLTPESAPTLEFGDLWLIPPVIPEPSIVALLAMAAALFLLRRR